MALTKNRLPFNFPIKILLFMHCKNLTTKIGIKLGDLIFFFFEISLIFYLLKQNFGENKCSNLD